MIKDKDDKGKLIDVILPVTELERAMVYVENNHPPIIPKEIFYQVRDEMARRSSKRKVM